jgi:hypothetical protein
MTSDENGIDKDSLNADKPLTIIEHVFWDARNESPGFGWAHEKCPSIDRTDHTCSDNQDSYFVYPYSPR